MAAELEKLAKQFKASGNKDIAQGLSAWAQVAQSRGLDAFQVASPVAVEAPKAEVTRFSPEAREALEAKGFRVYELTGQSIASLREQGKSFWSTWHKGYPEFEALASRHSEVAIDPKKLFIPRSNNKTLEQQLEAVAKYSDSLGIQGVEAILGEVPDYTELVFAHLDKTGQRLFGEKYDYNYTRTQTRVESVVANVGHFGADDGLDVSGWNPDYRDVVLHAAPLVVPTGTK